MLSVDDPACQVTPVLCQTRAGDCQAAIEVGQVGTQINTAPIDLLIVQPAYGMAEYAAHRHKDLLSLLGGLIGGWSSWLCLCFHPVLIVSLALGDDHQSHVRVLQTTKFGKLAAIDPGFISLDHNLVDTGGNQIHFSVKFRYPEAVNHIRGLQLDLHRFSHRDMDFIGSRNSL